MTPLTPVNMAQELYSDVITCTNDIKIILTGRVCVGKTSLFQRFTNDAFDEHKSYIATVCGAFASKQVISREWKIALHVWDTAGSERFKSMTTLYFRGAKAAIVCFDLTDQDSFEDAKCWMSEVKTTEPQCRIYLCGTKKDLLANGTARAISKHKIIKFAESIDCPYFETSSKTGENVDELFQKIADDYTVEPANIKKLEDVIKLQKEPQRRSCCRRT